MTAATKKWVGIEIGGTKLQIVTSNLSGCIEQQWRYAINAEAGALGIQTQLEQCIAEINPETIAAVGVGFGGPVDWKTGIIQTSHQIKGWSRFPLKEWLQQRTNAPVAVDNDANVAALAETLHGNGQGFDLVFYITIGSGIGGGVIIGKKIYHGVLPGEVEIGHIRLSKNGNTLESECSGWAINKKIRAFNNQYPKSFLAQLAVTNEPEALLLRPALEKNDDDANQIIESIADDLAFALSHVVHLFHPQTIIIGGGLSLLGTWLSGPISEKLKQYVMTAFLPIPVLQTAALRENVVPTGALELAKQIYSET